MNRAFLTGRLTADPVIREGETKVATYTLAVDRPKDKNGERKADFIRCVCFDKMAEFAEKYMHKGARYAIAGRIQTGSYTNRDGQKVYTTDVVALEQEFADGKPQVGTPQAETPQTQEAPTDFMDIPEDGELPFV